jgi:hypothetical protein
MPRVTAIGRSAEWSMPPDAKNNDNPASAAIA